MMLNQLNVNDISKVIYLPSNQINKSFFDPKLIGYKRYAINRYTLLASLKG